MFYSQILLVHIIGRQWHLGLLVPESRRVLLYHGSIPTYMSTMVCLEVWRRGKWSGEYKGEDDLLCLDVLKIK